MDQFIAPWGAALTPDHAHLVVADQGNKRLVVRDATDGRAVSTLTPAAGVLPSPIGVVVVPHTGQLLVTDHGRHQAVLFGGLADATVVRVFGEGEGSGDRQLDGPYGVALVSASDVALAADPSAVAAAAAERDPTLIAIVSFSLSVSLSLSLSLSPSVSFCLFLSLSLSLSLCFSFFGRTKK